MKATAIVCCPVCGYQFVVSNAEPLPTVQHSDIPGEHALVRPDARDRPRPTACAPTAGPPTVTDARGSSVASTSLPGCQSSEAVDGSSWEALLADPNLTLGDHSDLLPHFLAFGPPAPEDCLTCRPGLFCPRHTPSGTAAVALGDDCDCAPGNAFGLSDQVCDAHARDRQADLKCFGWPDQPCHWMRCTESVVCHNPDGPTGADYAVEQGFLIETDGAEIADVEVTDA